MAEADLVQMPDRRALPERLSLDPGTGMPAYSPIEMEEIEAWAGKGFADLSGAQQMRVMVWLTLRRSDYPDATLEEAGRVLIEHQTPNPPEPAS